MAPHLQPRQPHPPLTVLLWQSPLHSDSPCLVTSSRETGSFLQPSTWVAHDLDSGHLLLSANRSYRGKMAQDIPVTVVWQSEKRCEALNKNCSWAWGPRAARTQANVGVGEMWACKEANRAGCGQCCPFLQCGIGGPVCHLQKWNKN